jgi:hypothetical protein
VQEKKRWLRRHSICEAKDKKCFAQGTYKELVSFQIRNDDVIKNPLISDNEWVSYQKCALVNLPRNVNSNNTVWFIATDSDISRKIALEKFKRFGILPKFYGDTVLPGNSLTGACQ